MKALIGLTLIALSCFPSFAQTYLSPQDLGLPTHGPAPANVLVGNFNNDKFLDIARFSGNKLEIYYFQGQGYPCRPQAVKYFDQPIRSMAHDGDPWDQVDNIVVTLQDGTRQTIFKRGGCLDMEIAQGFLPAPPKATPPRQVSDFDFQMVWQSESHPYGMDRVAVGDLDNDGINELVTWWKESLYADTAYILIYKSIGDNQYELFMQEPINMYPDPVTPYVTFLLIDDIDQNGQKELIFTLGYCYFWEFSAPGVYRPWHSDFHFARPTEDIKITDIDQNGVKEITQLGYVQFSAPQQTLMIEEFWWKNEQDSTIIFYTVANIAWELDIVLWPWVTLAEGDFDNDGTTELVLGWSAGLGFLQETYVRYYRYNPNAPDNLEEHWLKPGIWATCANPVIADFDHDGRQELYAAGFGGHPAYGSAYVWKATGSDSGHVVWADTTTMSFGPSGVAFAIIDSTPCVINNVINGDNGQFCLFGFQNGHYQPLWQSQIFSIITYLWPFSSCDMDQDGKMDFVICERDYHSAPPIHTVTDWEQTTSGIEFLPIKPLPQFFTLYQNVPNPFNGSTVIPFELPVKSNVELSIFEISGRMILNRKQDDVPPGKHSYTWAAHNLSSGIYLINLNAAGQHKSLKAVLIK